MTKEDYIYYLKIFIFIFFILFLLKILYNYLNPESNIPVIDINTHTLVSYINGIPKLNIHNLFVLDSTKYEPDYKGEGGTSFDYPNNGNYLLYNSTTNMPSDLDVQQSTIGDCMMDSTFAALAMKQPNFIKNHIFQDTVDKNIYYLLLYYKNKLNPFLLRMNAKFPVGNGYDVFVLDQKTQKPIIWSHLYLKALAVLENKFFPDFASATNLLPLKGYDYIAKFDWNPIEVFNLITGNFACQTDENSQYMINNFVNRFNDQNLIFQAGVGYINQGTTQVNKNNVKIGYFTYNNNDMALKYYDVNNVLQHEIVTRHGYTLLSYDANTQMVTLRNPWGVSANLKGQDNNGIFTIPLQLFLLICVNVCIGSVNDSINNSNKPTVVDIDTLVNLVKLK